MTLYIQARTRSGAEVMELRAALDAVSRDKAALSEQLAVLKTQLCFVLQVCDQLLLCWCLLFGSDIVLPLHS